MNAPHSTRRQWRSEWTAEFDCAEAEAEGLVSGIGTNVFQAGFNALKRQMAG